MQISTCIVFISHVARVKHQIVYINFFFYKQLESGLTLQNYLYFQGLWCSKLLNGLSDYNWTRIPNHLVRKRTLNHLAKLAA